MLLDDKTLGDISTFSTVQAGLDVIQDWRTHCSTRECKITKYVQVFAHYTRTTLDGEDIGYYKYVSLLLWSLKLLSFECLTCKTLFPALWFSLPCIVTLVILETHTYHIIYSSNVQLQAYIAYVNLTRTKR